VEIGVLALAGCATALATGAGALPVFFLGEHAHRLRPVLGGTTVGLMGVASVVGLLLPAIGEDGGGTVAAGTLVGALFLLVSRRLLAGRDVHVGKLRGAGVRRALLVFGVLLVHSLPEGFAIGTASASDTEGLALTVLTSAPQPVGAVVAYLAVEEIAGLLPFSFAFAAGAMLTLVVAELAPQAYARGGRYAAAAGTAAGAAVMLALAALLGVE
jgi:ZIP family zinc transporter